MLHNTLLFILHWSFSCSCLTSRSDIGISYNFLDASWWTCLLCYHISLIGQIVMVGPKRRWHANSGATSHITSSWNFFPIMKVRYTCLFTIVSSLSFIHCKLYGRSCLSISSPNFSMDKSTNQIGTTIIVNYQHHLLANNHSPSMK